jgi:branched-chain amino acid transport system permease protein
MTEATLPATAAEARSVPPTPLGERLLRIGPPIVLVVAGLLVPQMVSDFRLGQMTGWICLAVAALGLNLLTGYNGQISVGHGALYGVGAYTCGLLMAEAGWSMLPAVVGACVVSFVVGVVVGLPALRIKGLYLALVTLSVAVLFPDLVKQFDSLTGGSSGLYITSPQLNSRGVTVDQPIQILPPSWIDQTKAQWTFYVMFVVAVLCFVVVRNIVSSRVGRSIIAVRDNEVAAEVNGVDVARIKVLTFGVSSALAGLGGAMFALWRTQLFPQSFILSASLYFLVAVVVGGPASILGPAVGAVFVGLFQDVITPELPDRYAQATPLILGGLLIILMLVAPGGIVGLARMAVARVRTLRTPPTDTVGGAHIPRPGVRASNQQGET